MITSVSNPKIKHVVTLRKANVRKKEGLTIVEGVKEVARAIDAKITFSEAYVCDELCDSEAQALVKQLKKQRVTIHPVSQNVFEKISFGDRSTGILTLCAYKAKILETLKVKKNAFMLVLEKVEKPGNLGAILRTADAVGIDAVILCEQQTEVFNPNVIRSSLGAVFTVPVVSCTNQEANDFLNKSNVTSFAATPNTTTKYTQAAYKGSVAICLGNEHAGLSDFWLKQANKKIKIPMMGKVDSLNVSSSTAVLLYEAIRQRSK